jgi:hypothetical protein
VVSTLACKSGCRLTGPDHARAGNTLLVILLLLGMSAGIYYWLKATLMTPPRPPPPPVATVVSNAPRTFTVEDIMVRAEQFKPAFAAALDISTPLVSTGQTLSARLLNGRVAHGMIVDLKAQELALVEGDVTNQVALAAMDARERLRVDPLTRMAWIHYQAASYARTKLGEVGLLPDLAYTNLETLVAAAETGERRAMNELGMRMVMGRGTEEDPSRGFFLVYAAALADLPAAHYSLGVLYDRGVAVGQHKPEALRWMALAASAQWEPAQAYVAGQKISEQRVAQAADEKRRALQQERSAQEARLESLPAGEDPRAGVWRDSYGQEHTTPGRN